MKLNLSILVNCSMRFTWCAGPPAFYHCSSGPRPGNSQQRYRYTSVDLLSFLFWRSSPSALMSNPPPACGNFRIDWSRFHPCSASPAFCWCPWCPVAASRPEPEVSHASAAARASTVLQEEAVTAITNNWRSADSSSHGVRLSEISIEVIVFKP